MWGLTHASLADPEVAENGGLVWGRASLSVPGGFCIASIRRQEAVSPQLAFHTSALFDLLTASTADQIADVAFLEPQQADGTEWTLRAVRAVWCWRPEEGDMELCLEFDAGERSFDVPVYERGALTLLWKGG